MLLMHDITYFRVWMIVACHKTKMLSFGTLYCHVSIISSMLPGHPIEHPSRLYWSNPTGTEGDSKQYWAIAPPHHQTQHWLNLGTTLNDKKNVLSGEILMGIYHKPACIIYTSMHYTKIVQSIDYTSMELFPDIM